jgi:hypothetical protein
VVEKIIIALCALIAVMNVGRAAMPLPCNPALKPPAGASHAPNNPSLKPNYRLPDGGYYYSSYYPVQP